MHMMEACETAEDTKWEIKLTVFDSHTNNAFAYVGIIPLDLTKYITY